MLRLLSAQFSPAYAGCERSRVSVEAFALCKTAALAGQPATGLDKTLSLCPACIRNWLADKPAWQGSTPGCSSFCKINVAFTHPALCGPRGPAN